MTTLEEIRDAISKYVKDDPDGCLFFMACGKPGEPVAAVIYGGADRLRALVSGLQKQEPTIKRAVSDIFQIPGSIDVKN